MRMQRARQLINCLVPSIQFEPGACAICQHDCQSRACRCTYMHTECAAAYVREFGDVCSLCDTVLRSTALERRPDTSTAECEVIKQQHALSTQEAHRLACECTQWGQCAWPCLLDIFDDIRSARIALLWGAADADVGNSFIQAALSRGFTEGCAREALVRLCHYDEYWGVLPRKVRGVLKRTLADARRVRSVEPDPFDEFAAISSCTM